jgi:carbamoylphosphate synthase large subunit
MMNSIRKTGGEMMSTNLPVSTSSTEAKPTSVNISQYEGSNSSSASSYESESSSNVSKILDLPIRLAPKDERTLAEQEKTVTEILRLDKDPVRALQKALKMPKFFRSQK